MIKLQFSNPKYSIAKGNQLKTICTFKCLIVNTETKQVLYKFTQAAKVTCASADKYDIVTGRRIAFVKAQIKCYTKAFNLMQNMWKEAMNTFNVYDQFIQDMESFRDAEIIHYNQLCRTDI